MWRPLRLGLLLLGGSISAFGAAVDWRLVGDWAGGGQHAGFVVSFAVDGGYVIAQEGIPAGFGTYAVDGRQMLLFPGGTGEFPERGAYGFSGPDRLFIMSPNLGRSEWQRVTPFGMVDRTFEYGEQDADDRSAFERAVEQLEKLSAALESAEEKLAGEEGSQPDTAETQRQGGRKRSLFDRVKDTARKTAGSAGNLTRKAARSVKAAGDAIGETWKGDEGEEGATEGSGGDAPATPGVNPMLAGAAPTPAAGTASVSTGLEGGIGAPAATPLPAFGAKPEAVAVDATLAHRAAQQAAQWKADATLVEIVAYVDGDGRADVATPPQAVSLLFVSSGTPGEGVTLALAPGGSYVSSPAAGSEVGVVAPPATFVSAGRAVAAALQAGASGEAFHVRLMRVGDTRSFGWTVVSVAGGPEIVIDAVTGQPLR